jgi:hypothetical protein
MTTDYKQQDDDLLIEDGDFVVTESTVQHQSDLLRLKKGELRQFPKTGVGIDDFLLDDNAGDIYQEIQRQFEADGLLIRRLEVNLDLTTNKLEPDIEAYYEE